MDIPAEPLERYMRFWNLPKYFIEEIDPRYKRFDPDLALEVVMEAISSAMRNVVDTHVPQGD